MSVSESEPLATFLYAIKSELNTNPPDKEIEIHKIIPKEGKPFLSYEQIAKIEKSLSEIVCKTWNSNLS